MENKNALIFDFMGCIHSKEPDIDKWEMDNLSYHRDWNILMPVVIRCHTIDREKQNEFGGSHNINKDLDDPTGWRAWSYHHVHLYTDINVVYRAVIKFIEFYNSSLK